MFAVTGFGVLLNMFNSGVRKKLVDQVKLKRIMRETRAWQKQRMAAFRSKDLEKQASLNKKSSYMNKMNMEMMQMNMRPMLITFVPLLLIFYFVLPELFSYTVALSPIPLNVIPGDLFHLTCTLEQVVDTEHVCTQENGIYLWAWYFLSSIAFSGMIMKLTKTTMDFFGLGGERGELGSDDPIIKGTIATMFAVTGFGVLLNMFNSGVRKKLVDQVKLKRIMRETRAWQKQRMAAFRSKDLEKQASLNKKSSYMNKMNMEMMQMNMRPMLITFVPLLLIFYFVLPELFSYTVALSPIPLNVIPGDLFHLTCTLEQVVDTEHVCTQENGIYLWAWYFLSSIAFSGMIMKLTKTTMDLG